MGYNVWMLFNAAHSSLYHGSSFIFGNHSLPVSPPFQLINSFTTKGKSVVAKSCSSQPECHPLLALFPASIGPTPYRSCFHNPIPVRSSPLFKYSSDVTSSGGFKPIKATLSSPGLCMVPVADSGMSPIAGKWHSTNRFLLNSWVTTVTILGKEPVCALKRTRENSTF